MPLDPSLPARAAPPAAVPAASGRLLARGRLAAIGAAGALAALLAPLAGAGATPARAAADRSRAATSPAHLVAAAQAAVLRERGVVARARLSRSGASAVFVVAAGRSGGRSDDTFDVNHKPGSSTVLDTGQTAYLRGDAGGLSAQGFTAGAATSEAGRWISVSPSSNYGKYLASGLTIKSTAAELTLNGTLTSLRPATVDGEHVVGVAYSGKGVSVRLYVRASGAPLPVEITAKATGLDEVISFSGWGRIPSLSPPRHAVAFRTSWVPGS